MSVDFRGHDISELLIVLGVLTRAEIDENDGAQDGWIFLKASEYFQLMVHLVYTTSVKDSLAGTPAIVEAREKLERSFKLTKCFIRALMAEEFGVSSDVDVAFFALLVSVEDKAEFFSYCSLLAPKMWS